MYIKVTPLAGRYHARLYEGDLILDEMACYCKQDIGWICREMLRWQDKLGNSNDWTTSARFRQNPSDRVGKVVYRQFLNKTR